MCTKRMRMQCTSGARGPCALDIFGQSRGAGAAVRSACAKALSRRGLAATATPWAGARAWASRVYDRRQNQRSRGRQPGKLEVQSSTIYQCMPSSTCLEPCSWLQVCRLFIRSKPQRCVNASTVPLCWETAVWQAEADRRASVDMA